MSASILSTAATRKWPGAHREVGDAEVEELTRRRDGVALGEVAGDLLQVRGQRRDDRALDEVVDDDLRREVGAGCLALA